MNFVQFSLIVFTSLFSIAFIDIIFDWEGMGGLNTHILVEMFMGLLSLFAIAVMIYASWKQRNELKSLSQILNQTRDELTENQLKTQKLMGEFSKIIQEQFTEWKMTQSEKEVALLLLKGLSLDEIASVRETKEKTVRQQASNLYKKAGLSGRHELVAFFFEDLLIK